MTLTSILRPTWVSYHVAMSPQYTPADLSRSIGLHQSCTTVNDRATCVPFPSATECARGVAFCSMWRTVGWLMSLAMILEMATLVGVVVILAGGKARREAGWRILAALLAVGGLVLFSGMSVVVSPTLLLSSL